MTRVCITFNKKQIWVIKLCKNTDRELEKDT